MKKFDRGYFYYSFVSSLVTAFMILMFFVNVISGDEVSIDLLLLVIFYVIIYIVQIIYAWFYIQTSGYELTETEIRCKSGVFFRKSAVLQYAKVHAVNKKQGVIQRIFGIAVLTVDSGATSNAFTAEILIIEKAATVDRLMREIKQRQEGKYSIPDTVEGEQKQNLYSFTSKLKIAYSAITVCTALVTLFVLGVVAVLLFLIVSYILRVSVQLSLGELLLGAVFVTIILCVLCMIVSLIGGVVASFFGYHDFKIFRNQDDVEVNYGLFVRHTNNFKFQRIKAVKIHQGPIKKLFGFVSAGLEVVGYGNGTGDNNNNSNTAPGVLLPLCKEKDVNMFIGKILPDYTPDQIEHKSKSYLAFILWPFFGISVVFGVSFVMTIAVMLMFSVQSGIVLKVALLFVVAFITVLLTTAVFYAFQYCNAGLAIGEDKLTLQEGIFVKTITVIKRKDLIAVEKVTTPLRKAKGIYSYKIHFFTNALTNTVMVKNLDADLASRLEGFLKF